VLEVKEKPDGRRDDPHLAEKLCAEIEGIFLWAFQGLQRLVENNFAFSKSDRSIANREAANEPIQKVYHELFDDAQEQYNAKQTRADRRIESYYEKIRTGKQEKPFHICFFWRCFRYRFWDLRCFPPLHCLF
jgi:putative DNA primase/helicase